MTGFTRSRREGCSQLRQMSGFPARYTDMRVEIGTADAGSRTPIERDRVDEFDCELSLAIALLELLTNAVLHGVLFRSIFETQKRTSTELYHH